MCRSFNQRTDPRASRTVRDAVGVSWLNAFPSLMCCLFNQRTDHCVSWTVWVDVGGQFAQGELILLRPEMYRLTLLLSVFSKFNVLFIQSKAGIVVFLYYELIWAVSIKGKHHVLTWDSIWSYQHISWIMSIILYFVDQCVSTEWMNCWLTVRSGLLKHWSTKLHFNCNIWKY